MKRWYLLGRKSGVSRAVDGSERKHGQHETIAASTISTASTTSTACAASRAVDAGPWYLFFLVSFAGFVPAQS